MSEQKVAIVAPVAEACLAKAVFPEADVFLTRNRSLFVLPDARVFDALSTVVDFTLEHKSLKVFGTDYPYDVNDLYGRFARAMHVDDFSLNKFVIDFIRRSYYCVEDLDSTHPFPLMTGQFLSFHSSRLYFEYKDYCSDEETRPNFLSKNYDVILFGDGSTYKKDIHCFWSEPSDPIYGDEIEFVPKKDGYILKTTHYDYFFTNSNATDFHEYGATWTNTNYKRVIPKSSSDYRDYVRGGLKDSFPRKQKYFGSLTSFLDLSLYDVYQQLLAIKENNLEDYLKVTDFAAS